MVNVNYLAHQLRMAADCIARCQDVLPTVPVEPAGIREREDGPLPASRRTVRKEITNVGSFDVPACDKAPGDWECQREKGHDGPCAAAITRSGEMVDVSGNTIGWQPNVDDQAAAVDQVEDLHKRVACVETRLTELAGAVAALEHIALEINVDACMKHGLNPF
jgi:hypothetical protein